MTYTIGQVANQATNTLSMSKYFNINHSAGTRDDNE